jgi:hypothetical protein
LGVSKRVEGDNNLNVRRKGIWIIVGMLAGISMLAALAVAAVAYGQASEAAMTTCSSVPSEARKGATTVTVESRFLPWKFTCLFWDQSDHLVAKSPAPYEPPWPWR